jgi:tRNA-Thr(GGU) m(6)t(6)A37 methyltransferase TsaA
MSSPHSTVLHPIGIVRSPLTEREKAPNQGDEGAPEARIEVTPSVRAGLEGIEAGDDLVVITWLHEARRDVLRTHPRGDTAVSLKGVFATRSPDRPNPLGLHRVTVLEIAGCELRVRPLEAIDGTPVVDIKPARLRGRGPT